MDLHIFQESNHKVVALAHKYIQQAQKAINALCKIAIHVLIKYIVQNVTSIIIYYTMLI
jgi:hypothetical protein